MCAYLVLLLHVVSRRPLGNRVEQLVFSFSCFVRMDGVAGTRRGSGRANGEAGAVAATGIAVIKLCRPLDARAPMQLSVPLFFWTAHRKKCPR
jgi:hypothetical protein